MPPARRLVLIACVLCVFSVRPTAAQNTQTVYLPLVANVGTAPTVQPLPPVEELAAVGSPVYIYGAVQPGPIIDRTGAWWGLIYWIRTTDQPGSYIGRWRDAGPIELMSTRLSNGPRGSLAVGCDTKLYAFIPDGEDPYVFRVYRLNQFPGPSYAIVCDGTATRYARSGRGWAATP